VRVAIELVEVKLARQATQQKKKEGPHRGPSSYFQTPELNWMLVCRNFRLVFRFYLSTESRVTALRLVRGVLVFPAAFLRVMAFVMVL